MRIFSLFFLFLTTLHAQDCYFVPPTGWEIAQLKTPSPHVKIGFLGKGSAEFRPSINLAIEEVDVPLKEYVKAVKELQTAEPNVKWRDLGNFSMKGGVGRLTEISTLSPYGEITMLQAFLIAHSKAYILTAAVLKQDFPKFQAQLLESIRSMTPISDLWTPISDPEKRQAFQTLFSSLGTGDNPEQQWQTFSSQVQTLSQLGPYWQFLALQEGRTKIDSTREFK